MKRALVFLTATALFASFSFADAVKFFEEGRAALASGDFIAAKAGFDGALKEDPSLSPAAAKEWFGAGTAKMKAGEIDTGAGLLAGAVALDKGLAEKAGEALLKAGDSISDAKARARAIHRAVAWLGPERVAAATSAWFAKKWGDPRKIRIEADGGWAILGEVGPGDRLVYVAPHPMTQRNGEMMRLLPASIEAPFELVFETGPSLLKLMKKDEPQTADVWVFPAR